MLKSISATNPQHVSLQNNNRYFATIRDNSLADDNSIGNVYSAWVSYFMSVGKNSISGFNGINEIIASDLPDYVDLDIFMVYFDKAKRQFILG